MYVEKLIEAAEYCMSKNRNCCKCKLVGCMNMSTMHAILEIRDHYEAKLKAQRDEIRALVVPHLENTRVLSQYEDGLFSLAARVDAKLYEMEGKEK